MNKRSGRSRPRLVFEPLIRASIAYTSGLTAFDWGGATIAEVLRQAWKRLVHKQWLIFYPLALAVINTLAFLAVYSAGRRPTSSWSTFFAANYERWQFVRDEFFSGFSFTPALGVAVFVGLAVCLFTAMLRAPLFRAIAGPGYPLAPRSWEEAGRLSLFYVFFYLVVLVLPSRGPLGTVVDQVIAGGGSRDRSSPRLRRLRDRVRGPVVHPRAAAERAAAFPALASGAADIRDPAARGSRASTASTACTTTDAEGVFLLVPLSEILVWSFISLVLDLLFIFLYEQVRNSPS